MKLVNVSEMQAIEKGADRTGHTYEKMMMHAGSGLAREVTRIATLPEGEEAQVLGLVGPGNNGGDTLVALAILAEKGWIARAYLIQRKVRDDPLVRRLKEAGGETILAGDDKGFEQLSAFIGTADIILDGVLGTGFKLPMRQKVGKVLAEAENNLAELDWPPTIIAVDCPSGVDNDTGEAAQECLHADVTVTMAAVKQGLLKLPAFEFIGELRLVDIGLPEDMPEWQAIKNSTAAEDEIRALMPARPLDSHKGSFGTAVISAGSLNYTGAAYLSGAAAYRAGVGLVTMAVPGPLHTALAGHLPEATWLLLPHELGVIAKEAAAVLIENLHRSTAMLIGPGLGREDTTGEFIEKLILTNQTLERGSGRIGFVKSDEEQAKNGTRYLPPLVLDADALWLLSRIKQWPVRLPPHTILTPHPGEMAVLTGMNVEEIQQERREVASTYAKKWDHVVVLKGAFSVIAAPDGRTSTIPVASAALARAGTGDVLSGLIVGLRAQGVDAYESAVAGSWIHAQAGLLARELIGSSASVMAGDVLECVSDVMNSLIY